MDVLVSHTLNTCIKEPALIAEITYNSVFSKIQIFNLEEHVLIREYLGPPAHVNMLAWLLHLYCVIEYPNTGSH